MTLPIFVSGLVLAAQANVVAGLSVALDAVAKRDASLASSWPTALDLAKGSPCAPDANHVLSELTAEKSAKDTSHLKFYIHDTGAFNITDIMDCMFTSVNGTLGHDDVDDRLPPTTAQHMTDYWLLELMGRHPQRTHKPDEADFFVVGAPLMSSWFASKLGGRCKFVRDHNKRVKAVYEELKDSKYWQKHSGRDHFFINTSPWGHLEMSTHGDLYKLMFREGQIIYATADRKYRGLNLYERAIAVPYKAHYLLDKPGQSRTQGWRGVPITFHGDMGRGSGYRMMIPSLAELVPGASIRDMRVTHGFTPMVELRPSIEETALTYLNSTFCFVPSGDTATSRRLFDALAAGCIPVVLASFDYVAYSLPFRHTINWAEIAIFAGDFQCIAENMDGMAAWVRMLMKTRGSPQVRELRERGANAFRYLSYHSVDMVDALMHDVQTHLQGSK